ncbi:hypothetical protein ACIBM4_26655 [Streptomyces sp. NPDC050256]
MPSSGRAAGRQGGGAVGRQGGGAVDDVLASDGVPDEALAPAGPVAGVR